jgi:hypothetical protein
LPGEFTQGRWYGEDRGKSIPNVIRTERRVILHAIGNASV